MIGPISHWIDSDAAALTYSCLFLDQLPLSCFVIVSPAICPFKCFQELTWWCVGIGTARRNVDGFSQTHRFCYFITLDSSFTRESSFYSRLYLNEMTTTYNTICLYICNFHCYRFCNKVLSCLCTACRNFALRHISSLDRCIDCTATESRNWAFFPKFNSKGVALPLRRLTTGEWRWKCLQVNKLQAQP